MICDTNASANLQIQQHLEGPIGMALYEWQDGKIGMACVHGGAFVAEPHTVFCHTFLKSGLDTNYWRFWLECLDLRRTQLSLKLIIEYGHMPVSKPDVHEACSTQRMCLDMPPGKLSVHEMQCRAQRRGGSG